MKTRNQIAKKIFKGADYTDELFSEIRIWINSNNYYYYYQDVIHSSFTTNGNNMFSNGTTSPITRVLILSHELYDLQ